MTPRRNRIIAIDGPAASGKGTLARRLAAHLGYAHLDSGLLYREVARRVLAAGADPEDAAAAARAARDIDPAALDDAALRDERLSKVASVVAAHRAVRAALVEVQRRFAARPPGGAPGAVIDGRDIGTAICPDAEVKFFVEARPEVRAERRRKELQERGLESISTNVLQDMKERDARDRTREVAPLKPAADAFLLDTTDLDADQVFERALTFLAGRDED